MLLLGLRSRRSEIEQAIFARVREVARDPWIDRDAEYLEGLRATVAAAIDYVLNGIGREGPVLVPPEVAAQAERAARGGLSLDAVLRRYMAGSALLGDFLNEEAERVELADAGHMLRDVLRAQSSLLDELVVVAARAHAGALVQVASSRDQRLGERVRRLLAGGRLEPDGLGYEMECEHLGAIAVGPGSEQLLRRLAEELDRQLLSVPCAALTMWAWFGGRRAPAMLELGSTLDRLIERGAGAGEPLAGVSLAVGEPAQGLAGWRLTHEQAQAAQLVAQRKPQRFTRYADVALVAAALRDRTIAQSLLEAYLSPLEDTRDGGETLRGTLRAYLASERNVSCTAIALQVARSTVENRLRSIEERLGRPLRLHSSELEVALRLHELGVRADCDRPVSM